MHRAAARPITGHPTSLPYHPHLPPASCAAPAHLYIAKHAAEASRRSRQRAHLRFSVAERGGRGGAAGRQAAPRDELVQVALQRCRKAAGGAFGSGCCGVCRHCTGGQAHALQAMDAHRAVQQPSQVVARQRLAAAPHRHERRHVADRAALLQGCLCPAGDAEPMLRRRRRQRRTAIAALPLLLLLARAAPQVLRLRLRRRALQHRCFEARQQQGQRQPLVCQAQVEVSCHPL